MNSRVGIGLVTVALAVATLAAGANASDSWICCLTEVVARDDDGTIGPPDLGGLERPTFLRVDADRRRITLLAPASRRGEVTLIETVLQDDGIWVFSGAEEQRAWSLVIADSGHLTLSVTTDGAVWSVFGNAMREE